MLKMYPMYLSIHILIKKRKKMFLADVMTCFRSQKRVIMVKFR